jgi:hypothetical protein
MDVERVGTFIKMLVGYENACGAFQTIMATISTSCSTFRPKGLGFLRKQMIRRTVENFL